MEKIDYAHDCAMKLIGNPTTPLKDLFSIVEASWKYADLMWEQKERQHLEQPQNLKDSSHQTLCLEKEDKHER